MECWCRPVGCRARRLAVRRGRFRQWLDEQGEQQRVEEDRQDGAGKDQVLSLRRQQVQRDAEADEDERELADLGEAGGNGQRGAVGVAEGADDHEGGDGLADEDDRQRRRQLQRRAEQDVGVEQHADRDEEQHRESIAQRQ